MYNDKAKRQMLQSWLLTGNYDNNTLNVNLTKKSSGWLVLFNKCSSLPLVPLKIGENMISSICDTGSSKSLISSGLAKALWEPDILDTLKAPPNYQLVDVNSNFLTVLGITEFDFYLGQFKFHHNFIVFQSEKNEILLGIDFLTINKIAIYPSTGLIFEDTDVFKVDILHQQSFEVLLKQEISLMPQTQQVATFVLNLDINDTEAPLLLNKYMLFSSDKLEAGVQFENLTICFQYIFIDTYLEFQALIINHSDEIRYFRNRQLMGHVEKVKVISNVRQVCSDDLSLCLINQLDILDGKTLDIPESRICNEVEQTSFNVSQINCLSDNPSDRLWLEDLHMRYKKMFSSDEWSVGKQAGSSIHISLKTHATICRQKISRINPAIKERADKIISMLLERQLISISKSPWSSRVLFVEKAPEEVLITNKNRLPGQKQDASRERKLRLVIDFRHLNSRIKQINTSWPSPTVFQMLSELHSASFVSTLDISQGFFHYKLDDKSKHLTAFTYGDTVYHFERLPQGLSVSSKIMQYKMVSFIRKNNLQGISVYIDNLVLHAETKEDYMQRLECLFKACVAEGIKCKMRKCFHFIVDKFLLFGYQIDLKLHSITPEQDKITKICAIIPPTNKTKAKSFIGAVSYFGSLIPDLQWLLAPIHETTSPKTTFVWTEECQLAFDKIKRSLAKIPLIYLINPQKKIYASTDAAAGQSISYTLWQQHNIINQLVPVKFNSHKMSPTERNLSQWEAEGLALVFCVTKESDLLAFGNLTLYTDCRSLSFINRYANSCSKLSRWDILLRSYNMTIVFLPNSHGVIKICDLLTRNSIHGGQANKKLKKMDLESFEQFDFSGLPPMAINDCMALIDTLNKLVDKTKICPKKVGHLKMVFFCAPIMNVASTAQSLIVRHPRNPMASSIISSQAIHFQSEKLTVPPHPPKSVSEIDWNQSTSPPMRVRDILSNYLDQMSIDNLIKFQTQEKWIMNMKNKPNIFQLDGLIFRKYQINNGVTVSQILLPDTIAEKMIKIFHERPFISHIGVAKMNRHLSQIFYIRNFNKIAQNIVNKCDFCLINKPYPQAKLAPGTKIIIDCPRQMISLDICTVRSNSDIDSFLTILDNFSKFVVFVPISRNCDAEEIVSAIINSWVKVFNFPIGLCTDGAKHMIGTNLGEICRLMNTKIYRISPGNSQANCCERWNLLALNALKVFDQSYGISDKNFDVILSLVSNLLNQMPGATGFSPHYLQFGKTPRLNQFISMKNLSVETNMSQHLIDLTRAQNVCYILSKQMSQSSKLPDVQTKYAVGDFVLLRKLKQSGPRHGIKLRPIYYSDPFRIIKLFRTNAMLIPFNKKINKKRIKGEGSITKNLATIARISRLKPLKNPNTLLHLNVSEKLLNQFREILTTPVISSEIVEIYPMPAIQIDDKNMLQHYNPLVNITPENHQSKPIQVQLPASAASIKDICPVKLIPIIPGKSDMTILTPSESTGISSNRYTWLIIPQKKDKRRLPISSVSSKQSCTSVTVSQQSTIFEELEPLPVIPDPFIDLYSSEEDTVGPSKQLSVVQEEILDMDSFSTPHKQGKYDADRSPAVPTVGGAGVLSSRAKRSKKSFMSRINLPSGKSLILQVNPEAEDDITDIK